MSPERSSEEALRARVAVLEGALREVDDLVFQRSGYWASTDNGAMEVFALWRKVRAVCARVGDVTTDPTGKNGLASIMGKWPGDETDEELLAALDERNTSAPTPTEELAIAFLVDHGPCDNIDDEDGSETGYCEDEECSFCALARNMDSDARPEAPS